MTAPPLLVDCRDGVALLTFNRPEKLNALSGALRRNFIETLDALWDEVKRGGTAAG